MFTCMKCGKTLFLAHSLPMMCESTALAHSVMQVKYQAVIAQTAESSCVVCQCQRHDQPSPSASGPMSTGSSLCSALAARTGICWRTGWDGLARMAALRTF